MRMNDGERRFTGWHMALVMALFFGTIIGVNLTLAFFASSSWTGLVVRNAYVAGRHFNESQQQAREQAALGLSGRLEATPEGLRFTFAGPTGAPVAAETVSVKIGRPAYDGQDRTLMLEHREGGIYVAGADLGHGQWQAELTARLADGSDWRMNWRLDVRPEARP